MRVHPGQYKGISTLLTYYTELENVKGYKSRLTIRTLSSFLRIRFTEQWLPQVSAKVIL